MPTALASASDALPTALDALTLQLEAQAVRLGLTVLELGTVGSERLWCLGPASPTVGRPGVLFVGGVHGEEPAGPWGMLRFLEGASPELWRQVDLSFIPVVNPWGFRRGRRRTEQGACANSNYCHTASGAPEPCAEGAVLVANRSALVARAASAMVSLHEDADFLESYLFTFEPTSLPGSFSQTLRGALAAHFPVHAGSDVAGDPCQDGILLNLCDDSLEDYFSHEGVPQTACTETPGRCPFDARVAANADVIRASAAWAIQEGAVLAHRDPAPPSGVGQ